MRKNLADLIQYERSHVNEIFCFENKKILLENIPIYLMKLALDQGENREGDLFEFEYGECKFSYDAGRNTLNISCTGNLTSEKTLSNVL